MKTYRLLRLRALEGAWPALAQHLADGVLARWEALGLRLWDAWCGLFGLGTDELFVILSGEPTGDPGAPLTDFATIVEQRELIATVRPVDAAPLSREGVYVFRDFVIDADVVAEFTTLSADAWTTFETSDRFRSQPMGLFAPADRAVPRFSMLLVTWYDGLDSWQRSRLPDAAALENFRRRQALTHSSMATGTRLLDPADLARVERQSLG
jgi:hypothetical protein